MKSVKRVSLVYKSRTTIIKLSIVYIATFYYNIE
jgi:hypothetical protein